jgi:hypothetical protein
MIRKHRYPNQHRPPLRDPSRIQYPNAEWTEMAGYEARRADGTGAGVPVADVGEKRGPANAAGVAQ